MENQSKRRKPHEKKPGPTPKNPQRRNKWRRIVSCFTSPKKIKFYRTKMIARSLLTA